MYNAMWFDGMASQSRNVVHTVRWRQPQPLYVDEGAMVALVRPSGLFSVVSSITTVDCHWKKFQFRGVQWRILRGTEPAPPPP